MSGHGGDRHPIKVGSTKDIGRSGVCQGGTSRTRTVGVHSNEPPLRLVEADEVYRVLYMHAFGRRASIRIGKRRDGITVARSYYPDTFAQAERFDTLLTETDWDRLQAVLAAADFWSLPRFVPSRGLWLDGFELIVEGRRGERFHVSRFLQPDVEEYWQLGRVAFDLGGLGEVDL